MRVALSATSISDFKKCPMRYYYRHVLRVRRDESTEAQRVGTNWHALHETYARATDDRWQAVVDHLNEAYASVPAGVTPEEWAVERVTLLTAFSAYLWRWQEEPLRTVSTEHPFRLPLHEPRTGMPLPTDDVVRIGKIDRIVEAPGGRPAVGEFKTTTRDIGPDSDYWGRLRMNTQVRFYGTAARDLGLDVGGVYYDVWRRPSIRLKFLTIAETRRFFETQEYHDVGFDVTGEGPGECSINGWPATVEQKKGGPALRETPEMYGARFRADVYERPHHYFQRREIPVTDADVDRFRREQYHVYQSIRRYVETGHWWRDENACETHFRCEYATPVCYAGREIEPAGDVPAGFVQLTREGAPRGDEASAPDA